MKSQIFKVELHISSQNTCLYGKKKARKSPELFFFNVKYQFFFWNTVISQIISAKIILFFKLEILENELMLI